MNAISETAYWDPFNPEYSADIHPRIGRIREESPLYFNKAHNFYALSRYEDVQNALRDCQTFSSVHGDILEFVQLGLTSPPEVFIFSDPPVHTAYRSPLAKVFSPRRVAALEPQIRALCAKALDPMVELGEFDFVEHLGKELPMRVIGMLLGVPEEELKAVQQEADAKLATEPGKPIEVTDDLVIGIFRDYIDWRIKHPSDDLMTELLTTEFRDETGRVRRFTRDEVVNISSLFGAAGNDTTNRVIGWTGKLLADHPDQRRQILEDRALIPQAIEEVLRFEPPGAALSRLVTKDTEFYGVEVPAGSALALLVPAANRDPRVFENPDSFNIHRERLPHLSLGYGFHSCIGNGLARLELRVALDEVLNRFPEWEVDLENARPAESSTMRGWEALPVHVSKSKKSN